MLRGGRMKTLVEVWLVVYVLLTVLTIILVIIHNCYAKANNLPMVTDHIRDLAGREPILPWLFGLSIGVLVGHLWR